MLYICGLTHSNIHLVDFDEEVFKGVLIYEEVLQKLPNYLARKDMQLKQEEKRRILQEQFRILLDEDQNKLESKEQEKVKKADELE